MKKFLNIVTPFIILLAILTACESNDMPIQHADNYAYISFSAKTEKTLTRTNPYEAYDAAKHPATMGVFGYQSSTSHPKLDVDNIIYNNEPVSYNSTTENWTATNASAGTSIWARLLPSISSPICQKWMVPR